MFGIQTELMAILSTHCAGILKIFVTIPTVLSKFHIKPSEDLLYHKFY